MSTSLQQDYKAVGCFFPLNTHLINSTQTTLTQCPSSQTTSQASSTRRSSSPAASWATSRRARFRPLLLVEAAVSSSRTAPMYVYPRAAVLCCADWWQRVSQNPRDVKLSLGTSIHAAVAHTQPSRPSFSSSWARVSSALASSCPPVLVSSFGNGQQLTAAVSVRTQFPIHTFLKLTLLVLTRPGSLPRHDRALRPALVRMMQRVKCPVTGYGCVWEWIMGIRGLQYILTRCDVVVSHSH